MLTINIKALPPGQIKEIEQIKNEIKLVRKTDPKELQCAFYIFMKV